MMLVERLNIYEKLMRLDKPIGILLLLWPTLWALWLSSYGSPNPVIVLIFFIGTVLMRSAGCVINDVADRNFDASVERTRDRPLAAKLIAPREALILAAVLFALAFALVLHLNALTIKLSLVALVLALVYPFLKRYFWLPQAWLGIAFGFGIPMAFATHFGHVPAFAWIMLAANVFWTIGYDTEYAMVDRDDDLKLNLKSTAILFGRYDVVGVIISQAIFLAIMVYLGVRGGLGVFYFVGVLAAAAIVACQYWLIRTRTREGCFRAFLTNSILGAVIFAGIAGDFLLRIPLLAVRH